VKVVADTNVYVSAIIFGGKPQTILELAEDGQIELFISDDILAETTRILRDKFHRTPEQLRADAMALEAITARVQPIEQIDAVPADPTDNRILECAVAADSEAIISGDKHVLALGSFRGIEIISVSDLLQRGPARRR
jgi:putative PIN family toxin of toxin-antitoxin system